jgi:hypothetical protein
MTFSLESPSSSQTLGPLPIAVIPTAAKEEYRKENGPVPHPREELQFDFIVHDINPHHS